jgi:ectoine hydroxylase-related dioxygenase (phytanoyl-CoA dioxygenase family)
VGLGASAYAALPGVDPAFGALATAPNILRIAKRICGQDALLSSTTLSSPPPGTPEQEYHTDDLLYGRELFPRPLQHYLNVNTITALSDFTAANGATKLIPGSHRWHEFPPRGNAPRRPDAALHSPVNEAYELDFEARGIEVVRAEMKAGSTVFWLGATWHCRGPCQPLGEDGADPGVAGSTRHSLVFQ